MRKNVKMRISVSDEKKMNISVPVPTGFLPFEGQENELNKQDTVTASVSSCVTKFCCNLSKAYQQQWFLCVGTSLLLN